MPTQTDGLKSALCRAMLPEKGGNRSAVFFTGGMDSTVLAVLGLRDNPGLVFGAILDPACRSYNARSILDCGRIADLLGLSFHSVGIGSLDYLSGQRMVARAGINTQDRDLAAAAFLMEILRKQGVRKVLSGMGGNEVFAFKQGQPGSLKRIRMAYQQHQALAGKKGMVFLCPFLEEPVIKTVCALGAQPGLRKRILEDVLSAYPRIVFLMKKHRSGHSFVPRSFLPEDVSAKTGKVL